MIRARIQKDDPYSPLVSFVVDDEKIAYARIYHKITRQTAKDTAAFLCQELSKVLGRKVVGKGFIESFLYKDAAEFFDKNLLVLDKVLP